MPETRHFRRIAARNHTMGGGHDEVVQRLTEIGKRRRWALFKKTWLNAAVGPVAVIVATGCLAISFFTYRIFRDNNTVKYVIIIDRKSC